MKTAAACLCFFLLIAVARGGESHRPYGRCMRSKYHKAEPGPEESLNMVCSCIIFIVCAEILNSIFLFIVCFCVCLFVCFKLGLFVTAE